MTTPPEALVMNLAEIELMSGVVDEGLMAIVHTILFLRFLSFHACGFYMFYSSYGGCYRAHGAVRPNDYECTKLSPLTFPM
jgi:hypothetical protein